MEEREEKGERRGRSKERKEGKRRGKTEKRKKKREKRRERKGTTGRAVVAQALPRNVRGVTAVINITHFAQHVCCILYKHKLFTLLCFFFNSLIAWLLCRVN